MFSFYSQILKKRLVYVLHFPLFNDMKMSDDYLKNYHRPPKTMRKDTSPIAIFAVCRKESCNGELQPVAIQTDYKKSKYSMPLNICCSQFGALVQFTVCKTVLTKMMKL